MQFTMHTRIRTQKFLNEKTNDYDKRQHHRPQSYSHHFHSLNFTNPHHHRARVSKLHRRLCTGCSRESIATGYWAKPGVAPTTLTLSLSHTCNLRAAAAVAAKFSDARSANLTLRSPSLSLSVSLLHKHTYTHSRHVYTCARNSRAWPGPIYGSLSPRLVCKLSGSLYLRSRRGQARLARVITARSKRKRARRRARERAAPSANRRPRANESAPGPRPIPSACI